MSMDRCESYARQLGSMLEQLEKINTEIDKLTAYTAMAEKIENHERAMEMVNAKTELEKQRVAFTAVIEEFSGRSTQSAEELFMDINARLQLAQQLHEDERRRRAQFELAAKVEAFATPEERATAETALSDSRARYEAELALIEECTPARSTAFAAAPAVPKLVV